MKAHLMDRRRFIKTSCLAFYSTLLPTSLIPTKAFADGVVSALSVARYAGATFGLFGQGGGSDLSELIEKQTIILGKISDQIIVLNDSLNLVHEELLNLKILVEDIPKKLLLFDSKITVNSIVNLFYMEILPHYQNEKNVKNEEQASEAVKDNLKIRVVIPIQEYRSKLIELNDISSIPILALAMHIELNALLMMKVSFGEISPIVNRYITFFTDVKKNRITFLQEDIRKRRTSAIQKVNELFEQRNGVLIGKNDCRLNYTKEGSVGGAPISGKVRKHIYKYEFSDSIITDNALSDLSLLIENKFILDSELPKKVIQNPVKTIEFEYRHAMGLYRPTKPEHTNKYLDLKKKEPDKNKRIAIKRYLANMTWCKEFSVTEFPNDFKNLSDQIELDSYKLISLGSLDAIAQNSLNFCNELNAIFNEEIEL